MKPSSLSWWWRLFWRVWRKWGRRTTCALGDSFIVFELWYLKKNFKNLQLWGTGFCFSAQPYRKKFFFWQIASVSILGIEGKLWLVQRCKVAIQCTLLKFSTYQHPLKYFFTVSKITCSLLRLLSNDSKPPNNIFVLSLVICLCCDSLEGFSNKVALNF